MANTSLPNDPRTAIDPIAHTVPIFNSGSPYATDDQIIQDYAAPANWVAQCTAKADAFEAASQAQASAQGGKVGKRALVLSLTDNLMQLKRTATYIIENAFEDDVAALASWKSASHVEVPPKKKEKPPTP